MLLTLWCMGGKAPSVPLEARPDSKRSAKAIDGCINQHDVVSASIRMSD
jgi:hypothetical protein